MRRAVLAVLLGIGAFSQADDRAFFETHCVECHDAETKKGGIDLDALTRDYAEPKNFANWVKVHDAIASGAMPPKKKERPAAEAQAAVLASLAGELRQAEQVKNGTQGRATCRRLTRAEYEYTLQDIFSLPGMPLKEGLPMDGTVHGFNKVSEALDISHVQMARYLETAQLVLDRAITTRPDAPKPFSMRYYPADTHGFLTGLENGGDCGALKDKKRDPAMPLLSDNLPKEKIVYYIESVLRGSHSTVGVFRHTDADFPPGFHKFSPLLPGRYRLKLSVWSYWWDKGEVLPSKRTQVAGLSNDLGPIGFFDAPSLESKVHETEVWLEPNDNIRFNTSSLEHVQVYAQKGRAKEYQGPGVAVDWMDIEGPLQPVWPPASHVRIFGDLPLVKLEPGGQGPLPPPRRPVLEQRRRDSTFPNPADHGKVDGLWTVASASPLADARELLESFLTRAFRLPAAKEQVERYLGIVQEGLTEGDSFEEAMRMACTAALCAPEFLFRLEQPGRLDDWAMASRLSYLLWEIDPPDDVLLDAARRGELKKGGDTLRNQVRRMLKDPRSDRFVEDFLGQWLALNEIAATTPDKQLYPDFKPYLQDSAVAETRAFFRDLLDHNLGIANLADSDFAWVNEELGKLYGLPEIPSGNELSRVFLAPGSHRGGLLTQASVLKVTANGTLTSPVKRGAWIMDRLLGQPPEPQPPSVTAIDPDLRGATTIRQQLDLHRSDASCAGCHKKMDPPGFALESFDVIGRWRDQYRTKEQGTPVSLKVGEGHYGVNFKLGLPVDSAGQTAEGTPFKDIDEFKALLVKEDRQMARNYLERLATYATGRAPGFSDRPVIEAILDKCRDVTPTERTNFGAYRMRSLLEELVVSDLFLTK